MTTPPDRRRSDTMMSLLRSISGYVKSVVFLARTVESLKTENTELRRKVEQMQRQIDYQGGVLHGLLARGDPFVPPLPPDPSGDPASPAVRPRRKPKPRN
jgi:hypothetical protein